MQVCSTRVGDHPAASYSVEVRRTHDSSFILSGARDACLNLLSGAVDACCVWPISDLFCRDWWRVALCAARDGCQRFNELGMRWPVSSIALWEGNGTNRISVAW